MVCKVISYHEKVQIHRRALEMRKCKTAYPRDRLGRKIGKKRSKSFNNVTPPAGK